MDKLMSPQLGQIHIISESEYDKIAKKKAYGIPTYVTLKEGYAYVYPLPANVMELEREVERLREENLTMREILDLYAHPNNQTKLSPQSCKHREQILKGLEDSKAGRVSERPEYKLDPSKT